jgi:two-component system chemotaxis response regulator CheY
MTDQTISVLLVDPDQRMRSLIAEQLRPLGYKVLEASDGPTALSLVEGGGVRVVVTELYVGTNPDECLIHAVRRDKKNRKTRVVAHTSHSTSADRAWAERAGADAYLIKPTRPERIRYVVGRLMTAKGANASVPATSSSVTIRRDTLDVALKEIEVGSLQKCSSIVFGRQWWDALLEPQRRAFRKRAKVAQVNLRSDSMLGTHFVEVRGPARDDLGLSTERPESPYRRSAQPGR